jgi:hypothetical protein
MSTSKVMHGPPLGRFQIRRGRVCFHDQVTSGHAYRLNRLDKRDVLPLITVVVDKIDKLGEHHPIGSKQPFCLYQELSEDGSNVVSLTPLSMLGEAILPSFDPR